MKEWPLEEISVELWRGLAFIAINPSGPLSAQLGDTVPELAGEPIENFTCVAERRMTFDANWKIYTDNFVEGYHIPGIHPGFFQAIEFEHFETTAHDNLIRMTAPPREGLFYKGKWLWMWAQLDAVAVRRRHEHLAHQPVERRPHRTGLPLLLR
jgi:choline monooxygenase